MRLFEHFLAVEGLVANKKSADASGHRRTFEWWDEANRKILKIKAFLCQFLKIYQGFYHCNLHWMTVQNHPPQPLLPSVRALKSRGLTSAERRNYTFLKKATQQFNAVA